MAEHRFDLVIIGTGPAGESAAMHASKQGLRVAAIDNRAIVGGNCTHQGTIPSKALRQAVHQIIQLRRNPIFRQMQMQTDLLHFNQVRVEAERVIEHQVAMRTRFYARNSVSLFNGDARFIDTHRVQLSNGRNHNDILAADNFIIATGSRPYRPPEIDFNLTNVFDSDKILTLDRSLKRIIIFGAGVIGCEYASIFSGIGVKVDLINPGSHLLSFMDDEIADALSYHLRTQSVTIRHNEEFASVTDHGDGVEVQLQSGKLLRADAFMWANGRTGNTANLALDQLGLSANGRGQLEVDRQYRTTQPHVFAVGDVIGWPSLASAAYDQGRAVAATILGDEENRHVDEVPTGIYTIPEISSVGKTEKQLTAEKVPYEVGKCYFKDTARGQITGEMAGVLKLLFHRDSLELLGIHCFGDQAAEILHIGQAIMAQKNGGNTLKYFVNHTFNYPTMAEAYRVAALNGLNRL